MVAPERLFEVGSLNGLNAVRTPKSLSSVADNRTAYILAGSFVGFLIEKYGLPKFKRLYQTESYNKVYGESLQILDREWRSSLQEK